MALQLNLTNSDVGYEFSEAYARILFARTFKDQTFIFVNFHADAAARWANKNPVKQKEYIATTQDLTGDFFPSMYTWLKTQADFAGAVDVLVNAEPEAAAEVVEVVPNASIPEIIDSAPQDGSIGDAGEVTPNVPSPEFVQ
jgi:hypothetical protein